LIFSYVEVGKTPCLNKLYTHCVPPTS
jgi:hypothetical protein